MSSTLSLSDDAAAPAEPERDHVRFEVEREHARGGLGRVLEARDKDLQRTVAIKEMIKQDPVSQARFQREAELTARLQHPGIVPIYERSAWPGGEPFYVMKMVSGRSLSEAIKASATLGERLALIAHVIDVAETIAYAHAEGVVHRDLKPSNVIIGTYGETVVIDWGIAKDLWAEDSDDDPGVVRMTVASDDDLTVAGSVIGTPAYMPPEQARGETVDGRADVYAIGAMLYHVVAGVAPFDGDSGTDVLGQVVSEDPAPLDQVVPDVAPDLCAIVAKAMARDARDRYPSARELAVDLERFRDGQLVGAREYGWIERAAWWARRHRGLTASIATAVLLGIVLGGVWIVRERRLREAATAARDDAERARLATRRQSLALLEAQGQVELQAGRSFRAAVLLAEAYGQGQDSFAVRLGLGEAMRDVDRLEHTLRGHTGRVRCLAVSPDGRYVATGTEAAAAHIFDMRTGGRLHVLEGHRPSVFSVAFSPDSQRLVTTGDDGHVIMWRVDDGSMIYDLDLDDGAAMEAAFSPDGALLATVTTGGTLRLWDAATGAPNRVLARDRGSLLAVAFSPDGRSVATAGDGTAHVWDVERGAVRAELVGHLGPVWSIAYDPTGTAIATAGADHLARVWDAATGAPRAVLRGHTGVVYSAAFSPDGERIVTASHDQSVRVWGAADGGVRDVLRGHEVTVIAAAFSPDGQRIVTGSWDQTARVWRAEVGEGTGPLAGHREEVLIAEFSRDGEQLVTWSADNVAQLWESDSLVRRWRVDALAAPMAVAFTADGARIAAGQFLGSRARLVDARTGEIALELPGHVDRVYGVDVSPDGRTLVTASHDGTARLWDMATGAPIGEPVRRERGWSSALFSPDGRFVAMAARGARRIELRDAQRLELVRSIGDHSTGVNAVAFSRDGRRLVTGGVGDHLVKVWDVDTGALKMTLAGHTDMVLWVSFGPDDRIIATAGVDQKAMFWDAETGERVYELDGPAFSVDFHPDGTRIAVGGYSGYARVLRLETRTPAEIARILDEIVDLRFDRGKIVPRR